jgi:ADP-ribosylglycohydrolase
LPLRDRFRGALLGLAAGDAVGTTVEFKPRGAFSSVTDMVSGGPFDLAPGEWTDDTSMALCLAESLIERGGFDPADQMDRYLRWYQDGHWSSTDRCFDIGNATRAALNRYRADPSEPYAGSTDPYSAGNGSLMRLAPVALFYHTQPAQAIHRAADSSRTTRGATVAVDACRSMCALIVGALSGASKQELLSSRYAPPGSS